MKKTIFLLLILLSAILVNCHKEKTDPPIDNGVIVFPEELTERLITDLDLLGKLWGFLKYHHPKLGKGDYDIDYELFSILQQYLDAENNEARDKIILDWITTYGEIPACTTCGTSPSNAYIKPDLAWVDNSDMTDDLKNRIKDIYANRHQGSHYYIRSMEYAGNFEFFNEKAYSDMAYPDAEYRLLTLYRYWNIIQYFFPYKYQTDKNWNNVLKEYVSLFISAKNRLEYELATLQIIGEINDTHAYLSGGYEIKDSSGYNYAPFRGWFIEGKLVVTDYYNPEFKATSGLEIGDVITHINGETVESIVENLKKYYPASNVPARLMKISYDLLRSNSNTISVNYYSAEHAGEKKIPLYNRSMLNFYGGYKVNGNEKCYKLLDGNIGYITLSSIKDEDIPVIKSTFRNTKGIIIDIRNYPSTPVMYSLGSYFVSQTTPFVKFTVGNINNPGEFTFINDYVITSESTGAYRGKLVVIVNEVTQSQAEFTAMAFKAGDNTTIIGSTTAGADGNVSEIILPGGLKTRISGIGVYYPDGTQTQRIGIVPDIWVEPTIDGIKQGKDELLEKAIEIIGK